MKRTTRNLPALLLLGALLISAAVGCRQESAQIDMTLPGNFDNCLVELIDFSDSTVITSTNLEKGVGKIVIPADSLGDPRLAQIVIDGRVRGFYVIEPGRASLDSTRRVAGTPLNDRLQQLLQSMDSVEATGDMAAYVSMAEKLYNDNRDNVLGTYFGVEWLKYADPTRVHSLLKEASADFRESRRAGHYINFARLRAATSPGRRYVDFQGEDASGRPVAFSSYVKPGNYTLVDFMASWCPYCAKHSATLKEIAGEYADRGLRLVSVAVRDKPEDTASAVSRHGLDWDVVYNTGRRPYDIYGFSGIPHYMLIGPDGVILERGEQLGSIKQHLETHIKN